MHPLNAAPSDDWGPWAKAIGDAERLACLRTLRTVLDCAFGSNHPLIRALYWAESGDPADLAAAARELERMPSRDKRKVLSVYGRVIGYRAQRNAEGK